MPSACVAAPSLSCGAAVKVLAHNTIITIAYQVRDSFITADPGANFFILFSLLCFGLSAFVVVNQAYFYFNDHLAWNAGLSGASRPYQPARAFSCSPIPFRRAEAVSVSVGTFSDLFLNCNKL